MLNRRKINLLIRSTIRYQRTINRKLTVRTKLEDLTRLDGQRHTRCHRNTTSDHIGPTKPSPGGRSIERPPGNSNIVPLHIVTDRITANDRTERVDVKR